MCHIPKWQQEVWESHISQTISTHPTEEREPDLGVRIIFFWVQAWEISHYSRCLPTTLKSVVINSLPMAATGFTLGLAL